MAPVADGSKACFVCGKTDPGKLVPMTNFKLKYSKSAIVEKIVNVVGNNMLVVCCKGDVVCKHCVSVMELIDKLEHELTASKRIILRLLEKQYDLKIKYEAPVTEPLIEPEVVPELEPVKTESAFAARKRKSREAIEVLSSGIADDPRQRVRLECDKCLYTTNYTTFIERHVPPVPCENCGNLTNADSECTVCANPVIDEDIKPAVVVETQPSPPISPSEFYEDQSDGLQPIVENEELSTNQIILPDSDTDEASDKSLTYLEFVDGPDIDQEAHTEVFNVPGDLETGVIWEEES